VHVAGGKAGGANMCKVPQSNLVAALRIPRRNPRAARLIRLGRATATTAAPAAAAIAAAIAAAAAVAALLLLPVPLGNLRATLRR